MSKRILFFTSILLFIAQSCVVYNNYSTSLAQSQNMGKVKLIDESGQVYKFTNIAKKDSIYYGLGREYISKTEYVSREGAKTPIDPAVVSAIYSKDKKKSSGRTVLLVLMVIPTVLVIIPVIVYAFSATVN
jgi:hypothetical protein